MIRAENLSRRYGKHLALDAVNFSIRRGEILGFLGPNGAGKSTAMNIITGYLSATEGDVWVNGLNVLDHPREVKKCIGYLPEKPPLYRDMTVLEYLGFAAEIKGIKKKAFTAERERILELVKIGDVSNPLITIQLLIRNFMLAVSLVIMVFQEQTIILFGLMMDKKLM